MGLLSTLAALCGFENKKEPSVRVEEKTYVSLSDLVVSKTALQQITENAGNRGLVIHDPENPDVVIQYREKGSVAQFHYVEAKQRIRISIVGWPLQEVLNRAPSTVYLCVQFPKTGCSRLHFDRQIYWMGTDDAHVPDFASYKGNVIGIRFWTWGDGIVYAIVESHRS